LTYCDGSDSTIVAALSCTIPVIYLKAEPFSIAWAGSIFAKVQAVNGYGSSIESVAGNGAKLQTNPDTPENLEENVDLRTASQLSLTWDDGFDGGTDIIDYEV
jgi:hypothetical protein